MSEIFPNLHLGDVGTSRDSTFFKKRKISHVLIAARGLKQHFKGSCTYMQLSISDIPILKIITYFVESIQFIDEAISNGKNVLVHCLGGISRSATIVIAYVMIKKRKSFEEALKFVKKQRPKVNPNPGFAAQLQVFEKCLLYYFDNTKGEKIDFPFLTECITPLIKDFEYKRI